MPGGRIFHYGNFTLCSCPAFFSVKYVWFIFFLLTTHTAYNVFSCLLGLNVYTCSLIFPKWKKNLVIQYFLCCSLLHDHQQWKNLKGIIICSVFQLHSHCIYLNAICSPWIVIFQSWTTTKIRITYIIHYYLRHLRKINW